MDTSYLAQQVTTIIGQLHGLFDEIGVPSHERDSREAEVSARLEQPPAMAANAPSSSRRCPRRSTASSSRRPTRSTR